MYRSGGKEENCSVLKVEFYYDEEKEDGKK